MFSQSTKFKMAKLTTEHNQVDRKSLCSYTMDNQISIAKASEKMS